MTELILRHSDVLRSGASAQLTRAELHKRRSTTLHGHDFYLLLWVQNDGLRLHTAQGRSDHAEGTLLFLRPQDRYALQGRGTAPVVAAVSLAPDLVEDVVNRHPSLAGHLFWSTSETPETLMRDSRQLAAINTAANALERSACDALAAEAFVLPLCAACLPGTDVPHDAPDWLHAACAAAQTPAVFVGGAAGLVATTGLGHPHVSRSMRKWLGQSPSDYVNTQRMKYAAARLIGGSDGLAEIAADCGIPNLSHFHKLFRAAHGMTPQRYRRTYQRDLLQP